MKLTLRSSWYLADIISIVLITKKIQYINSNNFNTDNDIYCIKYTRYI